MRRTQKQRIIEQKNTEAKENCLNEMNDEILEQDNIHDIFNLHKKLKEISFTNNNFRIPMLTNKEG